MTLSSDALEGGGCVKSLEWGDRLWTKTMHWFALRCHEEELDLLGRKLGWGGCGCLAAPRRDATHVLGVDDDDGRARLVSH